MKEAARWVDVRASVTKFALEWNGILGFNLVPAVAVKQDKMMLCKLGLNGIMCSIGGQYWRYLSQQLFNV